MSFADELAAMAAEVVGALAGGSVTLRTSGGEQLSGQLGGGRHGYRPAVVSDTLRATKLADNAIELSGAAPMGGRSFGFRIATSDLVNLTADQLREGLRLDWDSDLGEAHDLTNLPVSEVQIGAMGATFVLICTPSSSRKAGGVG